MIKITTEKGGGFNFWLLRYFAEPYIFGTPIQVINNIQQQLNQRYYVTN